MKDPYVECYLSGRCDDYAEDVDLDVLAEQVLDGKDIRVVTATAAKTAIDAEMDKTVKADWLKDNLEEIRVMGGDTAKAYRLYVQGRCDALACHLEGEVLMLIEDTDDGEDSEEDDEQDDPDGEEDAPSES